MYHRAICNRFECNVTHRRRLKLLAATLALSSFFHASVSLAAEDSSAGTTENANESILNWVESEDYIFTAERIPTNRWDTPANVHVITAEEIEKNHYQSVDEALSHVNGVVVVEGLGIFHSESASGIGTHMTGGNRILILIDGRRWFDPQSEKQEAKAFTGIPSIKMVERIEILKGGSSALYGSDAFNGVVNIITKKGTRNETTVDLNTGTWNRHKYEITNQGVKNKFSWFVTGKLDKSQYWNYKPNSSGYYSFAEEDDYSNHNLSLRLDQRFTDRSSITADYQHVSGHWSQRADYLHNNQINNVAVSYNFKEGTSTPSWLRYVSNNYSKNAPGSANPHSRLQGIEYQNGWELGRHKIIAGLEWHNESAKYPLFAYDVDMKTKSIYFQDTISLGNKWKVIPGVRYDHHSQFGGNWSPKLAANYRANERTKFYTTWGRSYNSPLASELFSARPNSNEDYENYQAIFDVYRVRRGNADLEPEKGYSFITGFEHDFNDKSGITVNFFQNKLKNSLDWDVDRTWSYWNYDTQRYESKITLFSQNHIPIKSRGVELTYHNKIDDHFSYSVGYSHTQSKFDTDRDLRPLYRPQQNGYRLALNYQNRGFRASLLGILASGQNTAWSEDRTGNTPDYSNTDTLYSYTTKKYAVLNLNLSYDVQENATLYFKALNLTNQCYSNYTSEYINQGSSYYPYYAKTVHHSPGRSLVFGLDVKF